EDSWPVGWARGRSWGLDEAKEAGRRAIDNQSQPQIGPRTRVRQGRAISRLAVGGRTTGGGSASAGEDSGNRLVHDGPGGGVAESVRGGMSVAGADRRRW